MKLKITNREKNLLLILLGIIFVVCSYYFGYQTLKQQTEILKKQNESLQSQIETLETIEASKNQYVEETEAMQKKMEEIIEKFPADMISEDIILYVRGLEQNTDSYVNNIMIPQKEYVQIDAGLEPNILNAIDDVTGVVAAYSFVNDGSIPNTDEMLLSKIESTVSYSVTYNGLKDIIKDIVEHEARKNVDNVSLVFNENTGDLAGSMTINYFALSGTNKEYKQPTVAGLSHGIDCIFGDLSSNTGSLEETPEP